MEVELKDNILLLDDRDLMVDAFALLGGNENLVQQMIHRLVDTDYRFVRACLLRLLNDPAALLRMSLSACPPLSCGEKTC